MTNNYLYTHKIPLHLSVPVTGVFSISRKLLTAVQPAHTDDPFPLSISIYLLFSVIVSSNNSVVLFFIAVDNEFVTQCPSNRFLVPIVTSYLNIFSSFHYWESNHRYSSISLCEWKYVKYVILFVQSLNNFSSGFVWLRFFLNLCWFNFL